jgi:hypothetical protein
MFAEEPTNLRMPSPDAQRSGLRPLSEVGRSGFAMHASPFDVHRFNVPYGGY